jgi:hypothetical protein
MRGLPGAGSSLAVPSWTPSALVSTGTAQSRAQPCALGWWGVVSQVGRVGQVATALRDGPGGEQAEGFFGWDAGFGGVDEEGQVRLCGTSTVISAIGPQSR